MATLLFWDDCLQAAGRLSLARPWCEQSRHIQDSNQTAQGPSLESQECYLSRLLTKKLTCSAEGLEDKPLEWQEQRAHLGLVVGRPILNLGKSWLPPAAAFLVETLKPAASSLSYVVQSSVEILDLLPGLRVTKSTCLATFDMSNLYPTWTEPIS